MKIRKCCLQNPYEVVFIIKGKAGDWYEGDHIAGFIRADGTINVCIEKNGLYVLGAERN